VLSTDLFAKLVRFTLGINPRNEWPVAILHRK